jgi:uncharacterized protein (TIGR02246 family)
MRTRELMLVVLALLTLASGACAPSVNTQADERAIRALVDQEVAAANKGDVDVLLGLWTEDAVRMQPNGPAVVGKEALEAQYRSIFEYVTIEYAVILEEVVAAGEWGFGRGTYTVTATPRAGGEPSEDHGKFIDIYRRLPDGTWKYARHIWNSDQPLP